jgi:hypothetical protein
MLEVERAVTARWPSQARWRTHTSSAELVVAMVAQLSASVETEGRKWSEWAAGGAAWRLREGELSAARTRGGHAAPDS